MTDKINIEVVYALPHEQILLKLQMPQHATVAEAIKLSGVMEKYPDIDLSKNKFGVYGKLTRADAVLRDRDRIEVYRPLLADPKEMRRKRAEEGKAIKKGGGEAAA